jgi:hypothetical protein
MHLHCDVSFSGFTWIYLEIIFTASCGQSASKMGAGVGVIDVEKLTGRRV